MWRVAEPNEALIISGLRARRRAPTASRRASGSRSSPARARSSCPASRPCGACRSTCARPSWPSTASPTRASRSASGACVIYKVGDDFASIANAARRFLDQQDQMDQRVHNVFAGHLRAIVGNMTVEEMIRDREKLTQLTRESSGTEMEKLGLIVDSLQVQEIDDPTGLHRQPRPPARRRGAEPGPHRPGRSRTVRPPSASRRPTPSRPRPAGPAQVKQAGYQAEVDKAAAKARQAGPLSEATARQEVVVQETKVGRARGRSARSSACRRRCASRPTPRPTSRSTLAKAERDARIAARRGRTPRRSSSRPRPTRSG